MNWRVLALILVMAPFAALSGYAMWRHGYAGIWQAGLASAAALQILADLVIACALAALWMVHDARARGVRVWPYVLITVGAGSFGPLLYLLRRELAAVPAGQSPYLASHG